MKKELLFTLLFITIYAPIVYYLKTDYLRILFAIFGIPVLIFFLNFIKNK